MSDFFFEKAAPEMELLKTPFGGCWSGVALVRGEKNILIDSGADADVAEQVIVPALRRAGIAPGKLDLLLCTHTHGDHIGGHARLHELLPEARIGVAECGAEKLRDPLKYSKLIRAAFPQFSPPPPPVLRGVEPDFTFADGAMVEALRVIYTPGHDTDCVSFLDTRSGALFSGDSIQGNGTDVQGCALYMDLPGYEASLQKLRNAGIHYLIPGHEYLPWRCEKLDSPGKSTACLGKCLELIKKYDIFIKGEFAGGTTSVYELAGKLVDFLGGCQPKFRFLAMYTVREHLKRNGLCGN